VALNYGTITPDMVAMNDREIEKIARKEPALNPPQVLTEDDLNGLLNYARASLIRLNALFDE